MSILKGKQLGIVELTGSLFGTSSYALTASYAMNAGAALVTSSFATTGSNTFNGNQTINGNLTLNGTASISFLNVTFESASIIFSSGSNQFGDATNDRQTLIGTVVVSGSQQITGSLRVTQNVSASSFTGSLFGTASHATTAPLYLPLAGGSLTGNLSAGGRTFTFQDLVLGSGTTFGTIKTDGSKYIGIYPNSSVESTRFLANGNVIHGTSFTDAGYRLQVSASGAVSGALQVIGTSVITGSLRVSAGITGSLFGTASLATSAQTASFVTPLNQNVQITGSLSNGLGVRANGQYSHAQGANTAADGAYSHTEGTNNIASGNASHVEGTNSVASGEFSHAEGNYTIASGLGAHTEGGSTQAVGSYSHAEGSGSVTNGGYSHAEGQGTTTNAAYQHAQGLWNVASSEEGAFILGNGTDDSNRSNLIFAAGNRVEVTGSLKVAGPILVQNQISTPSGQYFTAFSDTSTELSWQAPFTPNSPVYAGLGSNYAGTTISNTSTDGNGDALPTKTWYFNMDGTLTAPDGITAPSFTGSLQGTATSAETASAILGGKATHIPYFITDLTLATSSIYQSGSSTVIINQDNATTANPEALYVWQPSSTSINVISGKGNLNNYLQLNIQNTNQGVSASSDVVATANNGNESANYIDMGINSETYSQNFIGAANDAYLYSTGNDLHIGNATPNKPLQFFAGGSDVDVYNKLQLNPNNQHSMSGSLDVSGSVKAFSFTGSLQGNATSATTSSYSITLGASLSQPATNQVRLLNSAGSTLSTATINNVTSASHADNASSADYATTAGNGGVTQLVAGSGITLIPSSGQGAVTVVSSGGGGVTIISGSLVTGSFTNTTSYTFNHNLSTRTPIITVFDSNYNQIIPQNIELTSTASATITFPTPESGFAIGSTGGTTGTALSSSYALIAEYAYTASFYQETDPVYIAQKPTLATTGSNVFRGNQIVTGSLFTTGSNTLVGSTALTGSLSISGSTIQTGNNTLIGTTTLTGSILINGNVIPQISSSFDLGSETNPWRSIYLQSGSISIRSDIPGGLDAVISNANGNVTFTQAGFQLKSGSFVPFEVSSSARTIIRVPNVPANDVGGLSIIGSSTGVYQGVTNAGGLLHLTSNDGVSSRITSDAYGTAANAAYVGRKARGTAATPLPVQSGDVLTRISSIGWTGPEYGFTMSSSLITAPTTIDVVALENYTTSSFGSRFNLYSVPLGSTIRTLSAQIDTTGITIPSTSKFFGTASWANNAQTASYVRPLVQDVIITGSLKVSGSLTEIGNTVFSGSVTLNSGSALNINDGFYVNGNKQFNYGQFSSTQTQSGSADTAYSLTFNTTDFANGVSLVSGSRITIANTGLYNIQFSSQLHTTANQAVDFSIWFAMTGSNIANSNTDYTVEKISGGGYAVAALNFLTQIQSGSYIELKYSKTTLEGQLQAKGTQSTPTRPATPSVIVTVTQIA